MPPIHILILSDDRPGHYHLSEGVAAAIRRRRPVVVEKLNVSRRRSMPNRVLSWMLAAGLPPRRIFRAAYGRDLPHGSRVDLVISAGGDTLAGNVAAARALGAANIFCGTLRHLPPDAFSLVVSSYARHDALPRHLVALKPSGIDPDQLKRTSGPSAGVRSSETVGDTVAPRIAGLLIGGDSGFFTYTDAEWDRLLAFVLESHRALGIRWIVSTSRRSPDHVGDKLAALAKAPGGPIAEFIDFRTAGPGTLSRLFAEVDAVLCTEDSSTMISEAICARLPAVGVAPVHHGFKDEEREYRELMKREGWCRFLPLAELDARSYAAALSQVAPLKENHLDRLANQIAQRLPQLFA